MAVPASVKFLSSHCSARSGGSTNGMRSWIFPNVVLAGPTTIEQDSITSAPPSHRSHKPANASSSPLAPCRNQGRLPEGSSCHSYQPNAGMTQRRRLRGSLKLAALTTVSTRALKVLYLMRGSVDQYGRSHHCNRVSSSSPPSDWRTTGT